MNWSLHLDHFIQILSVFSETGKYVILYFKRVGGVFSIKLFAKSFILPAGLIAGHCIQGDLFGNSAMEREAPHITFRQI